MAFFKKSKSKSDSDGGKKYKSQAKFNDDHSVIDENEILVVDEVVGTADKASDSFDAINSESIAVALRNRSDSPINLHDDDVAALDDNHTSLGDFNALRESLANFTPPAFTANINDSAPNIDVTPEEITDMPTIAKTAESISPKAPDEELLPAIASLDVDNLDEDALDDDMDVDGIREPVISRRTNLSDLRLDVTRISSDIDNGEALYRRAQQRVDSLMHFIESAEVDFSLLNRLEPENRRLKAQNRAYASEIENQNHRLAVVHSDLEDHQRRLLETKNQFDGANARVSKITAALQDSEKDLKRTSLDLDAITLKFERQKTTLELEKSENTTLREKVTSLSGALDDANNEKMIFAKRVESLKIDCDDQRNIKDTLQTEIYELRNALEMSKKQNSEMRGQLSSLQEDIKSFKTQYEFNLISRDDRIAVLDSEVENLSNQLKIKDEIASEAVRDVNELRKSRTTFDLERQRLEKTNLNLTEQIEDIQRDLLFSRQEANRYEQRFHEASAALEMAHQREAVAPPPTPEATTSNEKKTIKPRTEVKQAAPKEVPVKKVVSVKKAPTVEEIKTAPPVKSERIMPKLAAVAPVTTDKPASVSKIEKLAANEISTKSQDSQSADIDEDEITEDEINDMITEFKLGIRSKIG